MHGREAKRRERMEMGFMETWFFKFFEQTVLSRKWG